MIPILTPNTWSLALVSGGSFDWMTDNGNPFASYNPKEATDYNNSLVDTSGNGHDLTLFTPAWTSSVWSSGVGWTTSSTETARTDFGFDDGEWTVACKFSTVTNTGGHLWGTSLNGGAPHHSFIPSSGGNYTYQWQTNTITGTAITEGIVIASGPKFFINGSLAGTVTGTWSGATSVGCNLCSRWAVVNTGYCNAVYEAFGFWDKVLSDSEVETLYQGMLLI